VYLQIQDEKMNAELLVDGLMAKPEENKEREQYRKDIDTNNKESEYRHMSVFATYLTVYTTEVTSLITILKGKYFRKNIKPLEPA